MRIFVAIFASVAVVTAILFSALSSGASTTENIVDGIVVDGRPLEGANRASIVIPNDLSAVAGAVISIPALGATTTSDQSGRFHFETLPVSASPYTKVDIEVNASGFGQWLFQGYPIRVGVGGNRMYVELTTADQAITATPVEERGVRPGNENPSLPGEGGEAATPLSACSGYFSNDTPPPTMNPAGTWTQTTRLTS